MSSLKASTLENLYERITATGSVELFSPLESFRSADGSGSSDAAAASPSSSASPDNVSSDIASLKLLEDEDSSSTPPSQETTDNDATACDEYSEIELTASPTDPRKRWNPFAKKKTAAGPVGPSKPVDESLVEQATAKLKQANSGIKQRDTKYGRCFKGKYAVAWAQESFNVDKETAVALLQTMQVRRVFKSVGKPVMIDDNNNLYQLSQKKKVVIIGGGFAGSLCAKKLEKDFEVTLFDKKEHFECTLSFPQLCVGPQRLEKMRVRHREYAKFSRYFHCEVTKVTENKVYFVDSRDVEPEDPVKDSNSDSSSSSSKDKDKDKEAPGAVSADNGKLAPQEASVDFDYLLVGSGVSFRPPFPIEGNSVVVNPYVSHSIIQNYDKLLKAERVAIIGAGPVGVEVLGEIASAHPDKKIWVISNAELFMDRFCKRVKKNKLVTTVHQQIMKAVSKFPNVRLLMGERVIRIKDNVLEIEKRGSAMHLEVDVTFICIGCRPNTKFFGEGFAKTITGNIKVNQFLQVEKELPEGSPASAEPEYYPNVFAMGDITDIVEEKLAQAAERHAEVVIKNVTALEKNKKNLEPYVHDVPYTMIITIGPNHALLMKGDKIMMQMGLLGKVKELVELRTVKALRSNK